jgi:hypothetical protein
MDKTTIANADTLLQVGEEYLVGLGLVKQFGHYIVKIALLVFFCERTCLTKMVYLLITPLHDRKPIFVTERNNRVVT